ncbi:MAG: SHD1 domain-containing protein [Planctomycetota bacterium]|nr:SHD1 domain-containing protein [Planctomycetota bacterium]
MVSDRNLAPLVAQFVPLKVDVSSADWRTLSSQYPVPGNTIPVVYVIRADGQKIFGARKALSGDELPRMLRAARGQAGGTLNAQQQSVVRGAVETARVAFRQDRVADTIKALRPLSKLGPLGQIPCYAKAVVEANTLARKVVVRGKSELEKIQESLVKQEELFPALLALVTVERTYRPLNVLNREIGTLVRETSRKAELKPLLTQARAIDKARLRATARGGRPKAVRELTALVIRYRGAVAEAVARAELEKLAGKDYQVPELVPGQTRTWQDDTGKFRIVAKLIEQRGSKVELERETGERVTVLITRLSTIDRALLRAAQE